MSDPAIHLTFWSSFGLLSYTFLGYPALIFTLSRLRSATGVPELPVELPTATVVLAAHNEAARIVPRLHNLLASEYPPDKLNIIVVADGCTDHTITQIRALNSSRIQTIIQPHRAGKALALNCALAAARSEIIVFTDVRQRFASDAIAQLVKHFSAPGIGAVSGELMIESAASATGSGVDAYWRLEKFVRLAEARWDSSIGCTGAIYAVRRELFEPLPADTILDDVVIPMQIAMRHYRVAFEPAARAYDPQSLEPAREKVRKRRTLAGNYQLLARYPAWLLPWRSRLWWQLLSHKYLRLVAPFALIALFASNAMLAGKNVYGLLLLGQVTFYALASAGLHFYRMQSRAFSLPAGFVFLNWQALMALWHYLRHSNRGGWESSQDREPRN